MVSYRLMDADCVLATCLHGGPLPLEQCAAGSAVPAYLETVSDIPTGSVARALRAICTRYGSCGVLAIDGAQVVGKIRCYPQAIMDNVPIPCVQQQHTMRPLMTLNLEDLPTREAMPILHLFCIQVANSYTGRGIAGGMLDNLLIWAQINGWQELRARAVQDIPPLLAWCGQLSRAALERRGFTVTASTLNPDLRAGVIAQRAGAHGEEVARQWQAFAHLSNDEAGQVFEMSLTLGTPIS